MTIAAGFRCVDGVVIATDAEYSAGITKRKGKKIFLVPSNGQYALTIAGSGDSAMMASAFEEQRAQLEWSFGKGPATISGIQSTLSEALRTFYGKHIYPIQATQQQADVEPTFLAAIWTLGEGVDLFRTTRTTVNRVDDHCTCIGLGSYLGDYLIDLIFGWSSVLHVADAKPRAAYVIKAARDWVQGCGQYTHLRVLWNDGFDDRILDDEIKEAEACFEGLAHHITNILRCLNSEDPSFDLGILYDPFKVIVSGFRQKHRERLAKFGKRRGG